MLQSSLLAPDLPAEASPRPEAAAATAQPWPASLSAHVWRANEMGGRDVPTFASGFRPLDRELPGGGWPARSLTEVLVEPGTHCEWRLLSASLKRIQKTGATVFVLGAPHIPHLPGLRLLGIDERRFIWVRAEGMRERLWAAQQIIQSGQAGALMAWLPQAEARSLRRLQACASTCDAPVFVMRPSVQQQETSPAPLRVEVSLGEDAWSLRLRIVKRRGPMLDKAIELPSVPGGLTQVLARRAMRAMPAMQQGLGLIGMPPALPDHPPLQAPLPFVPALAALVPDKAAPATLAAGPADKASPVPLIRPFDKAFSEESSDELLAGAVLPILQRAAG